MMVKEGGVEEGPGCDDVELLQTSKNKEAVSLARTVIVEGTLLDRGGADGRDYNE